MKGNIVVGQSGGPTAVINSSVAGVYAAAKKLGVNKIYGMVHGIEGFLEDKIVDLAPYLDDEVGIEMLKRTPSAFLGSCRFKMPKIEGHEDVYEKVFEIMEKHDIECLFYAGGNDSMDTVKMLSDYAAAHNKPQRFMGVPKTIDNDLPVTDHCPGYGSAAKYIATSVKEIIRDNESFVIAVSEGVHIADGRYVCELANENVAVDAFGHKQMSGTAAYLAQVVAGETGLKTRAVEFSTLQRAATHLASLTDINEAFQVGADAVKAAEEGKTGMMITLDRNGDDPYQCGTSAYDIHAIANVERPVPAEWITEDGCNLNDGYVKYARPLIMGELTPMFVDGLPRHLVMKELFEYR